MKASWVTSRDKTFFNISHAFDGTVNHLLKGKPIQRTKTQSRPYTSIDNPQLPEFRGKKRQLRGDMIEVYNILHEKERNFSSPSIKIELEATQ